MRQKSEIRNPDGGGSSSAPTPSRPLRCRRGGFTLIEMLVVVLIMALLMGLLVRHMRNADDRANRAATTKTIEQVSAVLEEFFAEYGQYPPVPIYAGDGCQPIYFEFPMQYLPPDPRAPLSGTDHLDHPIINPTNAINPTPEQRLFTLGLVSFLVPRYETVMDNSSYFKTDPTKFTYGSGGGNTDAQWMFHTPSETDQKRDTDAVARWAPFLGGVRDGGSWKWVSPPDGVLQSGSWLRTNTLVGATCAWLNQGFTIKDAWGAELRYQSVPPHQSYKLWSDNPNMKD
jgi:prepilin-type N-terminal cleavage/methylation domain-containing protein